MSFVSAAPEMMTSAAADLATIGSDLSAARAAAVASTVVVMPAAADEVSASISAVFGRYAHGYQTLAGRAAAFHDQFVHTLRVGAASYAGTEAANDSVLRTVLHEIVFLQPLIQGVQGARQAFEQGLLSLGQGVQFLGQGVQFFGQGLQSLGQSLQFLGQSLQLLGQGQSVQTPGQGLVAFGQGVQLLGQGLQSLGQSLEPLGQALQSLGQSLQALAQDLQNLP